MSKSSALTGILVICTVFLAIRCCAGAGELGHWPTAWNEWPHERRPDKTFPQSIGVEVIPSPQGKVPEALPKEEYLPPRSATGVEGLKIQEGPSTVPEAPFQLEPGGDPGLPGLPPLPIIPEGPPTPRQEEPPPAALPQEKPVPPEPPVPPFPSEPADPSADTSPERRAAVRFLPAAFEADSKQQSVVTPAPANNGPAAPGGEQTPTRANSGLLTVYVPYGATVFINGRPTASTGSRRKFVSHGLQPGLTYGYAVRAEIVRDGRLIEETKTVFLTAGSAEGVAFGFDPWLAGLPAAEP